MTAYKRAPGTMSCKFKFDTARAAALRRVLNRVASKAVLPDVP